MLDRDKVASVTVNLGLVANIVLSVLKTVMGILGHSQALLADGINSSSDVVYYVAVKIFMQQAKKPADKEHPYGHRQLESISAIVVGAFILTTGIAIFWESVNKVFELVTHNLQVPKAHPAVMLIAGATLLLKIYLHAFTRKNAKITNNPALRALANDHFNDIMAASAVIVGVIAARMGFPWMDPAAGAVVAVFIAKTGISIILESSSELMDRIPDDQFHREVRDQAIMVQGVMEIEDLGVHRFGPYFTIDMTICVDGSITVDEGNAIAHSVEDRLMQHFQGSLRNVMIHFHPQQAGE